MNYRKKPIIVEAEQWYPPQHLHDECDYILTFGILWKGKEKKYFIDTLEGPHEVTPGDYIVTGIKGEKYPVKPDVFEQTYEPVPEEKKP